MKEFKTNDLGQAAYLLYAGHKLAGKEEKQGKYNVVFKLANDIEQDAVDYYNSEPRDLFDAYKRLKDFLFGNK